MKCFGNKISKYDNGRQSLNNITFCFNSSSSIFTTSNIKENKIGVNSHNDTLPALCNAVIGNNYCEDMILYYNDNSSQTVHYTLVPYVFYPSCINMPIPYLAKNIDVTPGYLYLYFKNSSSSSSTLFIWSSGFTNSGGGSPIAA